MQSNATALRELADTMEALERVRNHAGFLAEAVIALDGCPADLVAQAQTLLHRIGLVAA